MRITATTITRETRCNALNKVNKKDKFGIPRRFGQEEHHHRVIESRALIVRTRIVPGINPIKSFVNHLEQKRF